MANRSDFGSVLPRSIKRMLSLGYLVNPNTDKHQQGDARRLFIKAHAEHKDAVVKRRKQKNDAPAVDVEE